MDFNLLYLEQLGNKHSFRSSIYTQMYELSLEDIELLMVQAISFPILLQSQYPLFLENLYLSMTLTFTNFEIILCHLILDTYQSKQDSIYFFFAILPARFFRLSMHQFHV